MFQAIEGLLVGKAGIFFKLPVSAYVKFQTAILVHPPPMKNTQDISGRLFRILFYRPFFVIAPHIQQRKFFTVALRVGEVVFLINEALFIAELAKQDAG